MKNNATWKQRVVKFLQIYIQASSLKLLWIPGPNSIRWKYVLHAFWILMHSVLRFIAWLLSFSILDDVTARLPIMASNTLKKINYSCHHVNAQSCLMKMFIFKRNKKTWKPHKFFLTVSDMKSYNLLTFINSLNFLFSQSQINLFNDRIQSSN